MKYGRHKSNLWFVWSLFIGAISRKILEVKSTTIAAASGFWTNRAGTLKMSGTFNFATEWAVGLNILGVGAGGAISALPDFFTESAVGRSGCIPILLPAPMAPLPFSRAAVAAPFISPRRRPGIELFNFRKVVQITVPRSSPSR
jgi:hypothetical protein